MPDINKLKKELERRYKVIFDIPKKDIDFSFFTAIHDYVDFIETNKGLSGLIYRLPGFKNSNPSFLLVKKGRSIGEMNSVFKSKKVDTIFIAFSNIYAVYLGIKDFDKGIEIKNKVDRDYLTENREKIVEHLRKIRDRETIVGGGYFWFHKGKYHEWMRIVHQKLLILIKEDEELKKEHEQEAPEKDMNYDYNYDLENRMVDFIFRDKGIEFKGKRALLFHFFYMTGQSMDNEYKTYHDFNKYMKENKLNETMDSVSFRQGVDKINKRIKEEIKDISKVIVLKKKNSSKETNKYKWEMKI